MGKNRNNQSYNTLPPPPPPRPATPATPLTPEDLAESINKTLDDPEEESESSSHLSPVAPQTYIASSTQSATDGIAPTMTQPEIPVPATPEPIAAPEPAPLSISAQQVSSCLNEFVKIHTKSTISKSDEKKAAELFHRATLTMTRAASDDVLNLFWDFHVKYENTLMRERRALTGLNALGHREAELTSTIYTAFRHYLKNDSVKPADRHVLRVAPNQRIIAYLKAKVPKSV